MGVSYNGPAFAARLPCGFVQLLRLRRLSGEQAPQSLLHTVIPQGNRGRWAHHVPYRGDGTVDHAWREIMALNGIVKLTSPSIQPLLPVAYSLHEVTSDNELVQGQTHCLMTPPETPFYKRHRFPAEIISHCVWLYFRFSLSYRDVEEMMLARGVLLSHEAVRYWCRKFDQTSAH